MMALTYLIKTVFDLYLMVVILRVWLQLARADFYNPFSQFVVRITNPFLRPLRRMLPGYAGVDWAGIVFAFIVSAIKISLILYIQTGTMYLHWIPWFTLLTVIKKFGLLLFWILLIRAILSWVSQGRSPVEYVMLQLTEPLLAPIRRIIPVMGGLDLSVLVVFILLNFINILFATHIPYWNLV
ncbi:YggT family protein [Celerinatantimonas sp. MCCC 1A17872]|uniref:YggT family protein n=1 Tax=Celerinatantimonas sp. MCCC 1A17872 TaxID=3177514 RepID=UPI0038C81677